ncbi:MAG: PqqD family protein [Clostridia bacterium]|nr:PqqD family protein [Clostridia bacterium]
MKLNENFVLKTVAGSAVVMPVGEAVTKVHGMIKLNPTAEIIWKALEAGKDFDGIVQALKDSCNGVDEAMLKEDVAVFLEKLRSYGILED